MTLAKRINSRLDTLTLASGGLDLLLEDALKRRAAAADGRRLGSINLSDMPAIARDQARAKSTFVRAKRHAGQGSVARAL